MTDWVYLNGSFVAADKAAIGVFNGGWLHGAGLFETMRCDDGRIFRLEAHVERLRRSAAEILRTIERDALPSEKIFQELLERNLLRTARIRMTVTAGSMRSDFDADTQPITVCVTAATLSPYPPKQYEKGVGVVICDFRQSTTDPIAGHKTTAYLPRLLGLRAARRHGCTEAIWFTTRNQLAEGSISNVFVVHSGVLKTPPLDTPVLPGIARGVVLEIAREQGIEARECPLNIDDLLDADEVLLTNAIMQVMPVVHVEGHRIKDGAVGPVARKLLEEYRNNVREENGGK